MYYTMPTSSVIIANILLFLLPLTAAATSPHDTCKLVKITVKRLPDLNIPRNGHSAYCLNNEITVFGGHTTNFVLTEMEKGRSYEEAIEEGRKQGFVEADPSMDIDGWDAAAKLTALMNVLMDEHITPMDIEAFYKWLFGKGLKTGSVIHYHTLLHSAFQQAYKDELLDVNPFDRVERPKKSDFHGAHYSEDELVALFELCRSDPIWPCVVLAGGMGLRRSEVLGVRWSRIDMDKRTVLLDTKIVEEKTDGEPVLRAIEEMKNKSSRRTLPIPDPVYEMLETIRARQEINRKLFRGSYNRTWDDYVCTDELGNLMRPNFVTDHFSYLLEKLGLRHIRFHDLRHTFASVLLSKEVPLINVSNFLGHSTISTTANIYAHLDKAAKQSSADVISDIFRKEDAGTAG